MSVNGERLLGFWNTTLPNGLTVVFEGLPRVNSTAVGFLVRTGSRDEPREIAGMSHFLEHMCFKGTSRRSWDDINREVDELGALWNAFTWEEGTAYFHWVQSARVADSIDILSDMMRPKLAEEDFTTEKQVILEEIAMYLDTPSSMIFDYLMSTVFGSHPLGISVLGTTESVTKISHRDMTGYFRRRYVPSNMVFIATGAIDRERILAAVTEATSGWESATATREQPAPEFRRETAVHHRPELNREHLALAWPGPENGSEWQPVANVLAAYLGAHENSRLYWSITQKGLVDAVGASHSDCLDSGLFLVYASTAPDNAQTVYQLVREELARAHHELDAASLARFRTRAASGLVREAEHGLRRWGQLVQRENAGAPRQSVTDAIAEIEAVTPERIAEYLERFPLDGEPGMVALGPLEQAPR